MDCYAIFNAIPLCMLYLAVFTITDRNRAAERERKGGIRIFAHRVRNCGIASTLMHHLNTIACRGMDEQCCLSGFRFCRLGLQDIHIGIEIIDVIEIVLGRLF